MCIERRNLLSWASSRACQAGVNGNISGSGAVDAEWVGGPRSGVGRPTTVRGAWVRTTGAPLTGPTTAQSGRSFGAHPASANPKIAMITLRTNPLPEVGPSGMLQPDSGLRKGVGASSA
jgi:hypothetical protein